ncbi:hypothetical protein BaRGS_00039892 [Batillaria attramentaria]|uniref:Uncharacterized protein n=1 Tax=Batillaria attramentaria TaxID=370345 RepID=A0ABD0J1U0_9CAEN
MWRPRWLRGIEVVRGSDHPWISISFCVASFFCGRSLWMWRPRWLRGIRGVRIRIIHGSQSVCNLWGPRWLGGIRRESTFGTSMDLNQLCVVSLFC